MSKRELMVEHVPREGFPPLFVGYADGECQTFYNVDALCKWFTSRGVPDDDELWEHIYQLEEQ